MTFQNLEFAIENACVRAAEVLGEDKIKGMSWFLANWKAPDLDSPKEDDLGKAA